MFEKKIAFSDKTAYKKHLNYYGFVPFFHFPFEMTQNRS